MENSYGIGVTNRYALFLDDDADPLEVLKVQEQEKELKKKSKVAEKENKGKSEVVPKGKVAVTQRKTIKDTPNQKPQENKRDVADNKAGQKGNTDLRNDRNKFQTTENREERNNRRNREDRTFNGPSEGNREDRPRRDFNNDSGDLRIRGRGSVGRPRGGRGTGRIYDQRGKREFDRQSGSDKTGIKPVDKREGGGAHNWGSHKDIIEEVDKSEIDASWGDIEKVEAPAAPVEVKEGVVAAEGGDAPPVEEEPKQFTLDEWRAQKGGRAKPQYNLRKAGEGEDPTQWKKMYELSKKKEGDEEESEDEEYDASEYPQRVGRQKHILDIDIHFNDARRGGVGGRGRGRSGPRGPRGGGGPSRGDREPRGEREPRGDRERPGPRPFRGPPGPAAGDAVGVIAGGGAGGGGGGAGAGAGAGVVEVEEHVPRNEHQHKGGRQNAPKVDDEHDFPSLS